MKYPRATMSRESIRAEADRQCQAAGCRRCGPVTSPAFPAELRWVASIRDADFNAPQSLNRSSQDCCSMAIRRNGHICEGKIRDSSSDVGHSVAIAKVVVVTGPRLAGPLVHARCQAASVERCGPVCPFLLSCRCSRPFMGQDDELKQCHMRRSYSSKWRRRNDSYQV